MLLKSKDATSLSAFAYDKLLAGGWFRGARFMNKPEYICASGGLFSPVHIRLDLEDHEFRKSHRKLLRKNTGQFKCLITPAIVDHKAEYLYQSQKENFQAFIYPSLDEAIFTVDDPNSFRTFTIRVFDNEKLIATSFFDVGFNSMASLLGLYDKTYANRSLGSFTILKEIEFAKQLGCKYYYPGYVLDDLKVFAYKLEFGKFDFKAPDGKWKSFEKYDRSKTPTNQLRKHFDVMVDWLQQNNMQGRVKTYPLHYAYNPKLDQSQFYKYPLYYEMIVNGERHAVSYDPDRNSYVWSQIIKSPMHNRLLAGLEISEDLRTGRSYEMNLLETVREIYLPIDLIEKFQISSTTPTGQWSDPITSFKMKASFK
jgi:arginine-tRNA-protein transferase